MADFTIRRRTALPARTAFDRLVDWDAHTAAIPLTTLTHDGVPRLGQRFVARTGSSRFGFDDPMVVELYRRPAGDEADALPGVVEVRKQGRVVAGSVRWTVTPTTSGSQIVWTQHLVIPWLPRFLDPLVRVIGRAAYGLALSRLLA